MLWRNGLAVLWGTAFLAAFLWTFQSWVRWSQFSYTTFDLAFYVQALDGFSHGRNWSSLLGLKPFGNHADFIILILWPIYAIFHHPMVLVVVQNLALAVCLPLGFKIAERAGWGRGPSFWLSLILVINPILTFVALHEFHPEAFAAPLWLALYYNWQQRRLGCFWLFLILFLSCKENLGLMVGGWCFVKMIDKNDQRNFWSWIGLPGIVTGFWMGIYLFWLGPKWNVGNVDFGALYSHLPESGGLAGLGGILRTSLQGNLLWLLILPMLLVPLRCPLSLLPALPILLQHLLSWRSSEWTVYFHYGAPLLPVFWIAMVEGLSAFRIAKWPETWISRAPLALVSANVIAFVAVGTPQQFLRPFLETPGEDLALKRSIIAGIPAESSVVAPLGFQSHLASRESLFSLHLILKGLKTLSRERYLPPPPTDYVIVDYADSVTLDSTSGYYHPAMRTKTGQTIASSDILLHQFLEKASWKADSIGALTVFQKMPRGSEEPPNFSFSTAPLLTSVVDPGTDLISISAVENEGKWQMTSRWFYRTQRVKIPWLHLVAINRKTGERRIFNRGLCCPEGRVDGKIWQDVWSVSDSPIGPARDWDIRATFEDFSELSYTGKPGIVIVSNVFWIK